MRTGWDQHPFARWLSVDHASNNDWRPAPDQRSGRPLSVIIWPARPASSVRRNIQIRNGALFDQTGAAL